MIDCQWFRFEKTQLGIIGTDARKTLPVLILKNKLARKAVSTARSGLFVFGKLSAVFGWKRMSLSIIFLAGKIGCGWRRMVLYEKSILCNRVNAICLASKLHRDCLLKIWLNGLSTRYFETLYNCGLKYPPCKA